jgi:hypothetical protein
MSYCQLSLDFRLRHKDTLCCARIEIAHSIASCVANATCFLSNILPGCSSTFKQAIDRTMRRVFKHVSLSPSFESDV